MKKLLLPITIILLCLFSCKKEDLTNLGKTYLITETTIDGVVYNKVEGLLNEDLSLDSNTNWLLSGGVFVEDGASLYIGEGVTVFTDPNLTTFLSIKQGGKIFAEGTSDNPIVFTPLKNNPTYGDWGGIVVNGKARINVGLTAEGEGGTGIYGGTDDNDNSGVLRYVIVEYAGKILGTDNELNGFSFNGVGDGTVVEYIEAYKGADDGIEFFGGTVNVRYAISKHNQDDAFDWTHGWRGKGQYWVVEQGPDGGDRGIEADNNGDDNTLEPYSNPTLSNLTITGYDDGDGSNTGMRLREGTKGKIYNVVVSGFPKYGIRVSEQVTLDNVTNGELFVSNVSLYNNGTDLKDCDFSTNTETLTDAWFYIDNNVGAGTEWLIGWSR